MLTGRRRNMAGTAHRTIRNCLVWTAAAAAVGAGALLPSLLREEPLKVTSWAVVIATWGVSLVLLLRAWAASAKLSIGLERVRSAVLNLVSDRRAVLPESLPADTPAEISNLLGSLAAYQDQATRERYAPDRRLVSVLGVMASGIVVATEQGQVSLLNGSARELLGRERARVGTSLFASLERESVLGALARAHKAGRSVEAVFMRLDGVELQGRIATLPDDEGAVLIFPPIELNRHRPGVEFDLELHDVPPAVDALRLDMRLEDLPAVIVDTETTGLDVASDRIVSLGAVCAHGTRLFRSRMIDALVRPGVAIPATSTSFHGITDDMVAGAGEFPEVWADFERMARNRVLVGHNVPFDLTIMRAECERHGRPWDHPVFIDTLRLASLLNPTLKDFELETLAAIYQVDLHGRHTALGDAMVTAELFFRMIPRLQQQGFTTLGDLLRFHCTAAVDVIAKQKTAGWITTQPESLRQAGSP
jgi:DNA polymerase-3 subunit epsilon